MLLGGCDGGVHKKMNKPVYGKKKKIDESRIPRSVSWFAYTRHLRNRERDDGVVGGGGDEKTSL